MPLLHPEANCVPSGDQATLFTLPSWPSSTVVFLPLDVFQIRTVRSSLPDASIDLCGLFDPTDPNDVIELHYHMLRPWAERETILSEKALHLYQAAAQAENMIATLG